MNFCPLYSCSEAPVSSQGLRNIRKHCLHGFPLETLSVRGVCVMAFSSLVLQVTLSGANRKKKTTKKETEREDRGTKETESCIVGYWPYHAYTLAFLYNAFQQGCVTGA